MMRRVRRSSERPNFTVLDLFSGCGGLTEGFTSVRDRPARFIPVGAVELDRYAAATYASNFGPHVHQGDISDWIAADVPAADVVVGGPPCQGFSALGKRDPDDSRNKLWTRYAEVVATVRPLYFVLENVTPFLRSEQFRQLREATESDGELRGPCSARSERESSLPGAPAWVLHTPTVRTLCDSEREGGAVRVSGTEQVRWPGEQRCSGAQPSVPPSVTPPSVSPQPGRHSGRPRPKGRGPR
jgi:hypothetical protein